MTVRDQNGKVLHANARRAQNSLTGERGWAKTMWVGGASGLGTDVVTRIFRTRAEAREAWVDDWPEHGCIGQLGFDGWDYEEER